MFRSGHERRAGRRATPGAAPAGRPRGAIAISPASSASRELVAYLPLWRGGGHYGGGPLRRLARSEGRPARPPAARRADQHHLVDAGVEPRGSARGAPMPAGAGTSCPVRGSAPSGRYRRRAARERAARRCRSARLPAARRADQHHLVDAGVEPPGRTRGAPVPASSTISCSASASAAPEPPARRPRRQARTTTVARGLRAHARGRPTHRARAMGPRRPRRRPRWRVQHAGRIGRQHARSPRTRRAW